MVQIVWNCAVIKAHKTANSKTDVKACLLKHVVCGYKAFHYKTKVFIYVTNKRNSVLQPLLTCIR